MASSSIVLDDLPLFPLSSVLLPGARLQLRIFEPRYLDMLRESASTGLGFGVCLILRGHEVGDAARPAAVGTLASVTDFYTLPDGLLGITASGGDRFRVRQTHVRNNGLVRADVACWEPEASVQVPPELALLATILERLVEQMKPDWQHEAHMLYDDASWVGFRLAELLPLDPSERQGMLEITDPVQRLCELRDILPRYQKE